MQNVNNNSIMMMSIKNNKSESLIKINRHNIHNIWFDENIKDDKYNNVFRVVENKKVKYYKTTKQAVRIYLKDFTKPIKISKSLILYYIMNDLLELANINTNDINIGHIEKIYGYNKIVHDSEIINNKLQICLFLSKLKTYLFRYANIEKKIKNVLGELNNKVLFYLKDNQEYLNLYVDVLNDFNELRGQNELVQYYPECR